MSKIFAFLFTLICLTTLSQASVTPKIWTGSKLDYKISKFVKFNFGYQYRAPLVKDKNAYSFNDVGASFRVKKYLYVSPSFRFSHFSDLNNNRNRASLDVMYKYKKKKSNWNFALRLRTQYQFHISKFDREFQLRLKPSVGYKHNKKIAFKTSLEFFGEPIELADLRWKTDMSYKINKRISTKVFYAYEQELFRKNLDKGHIAGLMLNIKLKRHD
jgi:hypothetical protein